jgi:hypothetical protein
MAGRHRPVAHLAQPARRISPAQALQGPFAARIHRLRRGLDNDDPARLLQPGPGHAGRLRAQLRSDLDLIYV